MMLDRRDRDRIRKYHFNLPSYQSGMYLDSSHLNFTLVVAHCTATGNPTKQFPCNKDFFFTLVSCVTLFLNLTLRLLLRSASGHMFF